MKYLGVTYAENNIELRNKIIGTFNNLFNLYPMEINHREYIIYYYNNSIQKSVINGSNYVILGNIFNKGSFKGNLKETLTIDELNNQYYGNFIALIHQDNYLTLFRDITGGMELYYMLLPNGEVAFSNCMILLSSIVNKKLNINVEYVSSYLLYSGKTWGGTFLENIYELPNGCSLTKKNNELNVSTVWDPYESGTLRIKHGEFSELMENVISNYIKPFDRIILNFSGGLDSSAILYSLLSVTKNSKEVIPVNFHASGFRSLHEVEHAKKITKELNFPLTEIEVSTSDFFEKPVIDSTSFLPNKPSSLLISWNFQREIYKNFNMTPSCLLMSGYGGDHLFMQSPTIYSLADAFFESGYKKMLSVATNLCQIKRESYVKLYMKNLFRFLDYFVTQKYRSFNSLPISGWATKELINNAKKNPQHPIYEKIGKTLGKSHHIDTIFSGIDHANLAHADIVPNLFQPFLHQPIIEYALSYPTYELFNGKFNRLPVRRSVSNTYNTNYVWRTDKGEATGIILKSIRKNIDFIESVCSGGFFAKNNLVNKDKVIEHILKLSSGEAYDIWPFMQLFSAEIFLNSWYELSYNKVDLRFYEKK